MFSFGQQRPLYYQ